MLKNINQISRTCIIKHNRDQTYGSLFVKNVMEHSCSHNQQLHLNLFLMLNVSNMIKWIVTPFMALIR